MRPLLPASVIVLCLWISAGCAEPPPLDVSLLTGEPCEPPCWQGLTPGESTEEDVAEFMRATRFVDTCSMFRSSYTRLTRGGREEVSGVNITWHSTAGLGARNQFSIEEGVLTDITICPDYGLTLERLFERYGPPEKYRAILQGFERRWVDITLFYPTHGFTVYLWRHPEYTTWGLGITLAPESQVESVWYFRAAPLEEFLELRRETGYGGLPPDQELQYLHDWRGYGVIKLD